MKNQKRDARRRMLGLGYPILLLGLCCSISCSDDDPAAPEDDNPPVSQVPHISYYDSTNGDLKYAAKSGGSWTLETVDAPGDVGRYTSLVLR